MKLLKQNPPPPEPAVVGQPQAYERATAWLDSSLGQAVLTEENRLLERAVRKLHGDTLLWSGVSVPTARLSQRSMVRQRIFASSPESLPRTHPLLQELTEQGDDLSWFGARLEEIPLRNGCVDALVLHHTLELCDDPRAALREAARVLQPGGQMVICAFNRLGPFSWCRWHEQAPRAYVNPLQVKDWLEVLGFDTVVAPEYALFRPPFWLEAVEAPRWDKLRDFVHRVPWPLGNVFMLHVRKQSLSIRPDWQSAPRRRVALAGAGYPKLVDTQRKLP